MLHLDFKDIEVLLVDGGSSHNYPAICANDIYGERYTPRVVRVNYDIVVIRKGKDAAIQSLFATHQLGGSFRI